MEARYGVEAMKTLAIAVLLLASCRQDGRYLGNTRPPSAQRFVYDNGEEPSTFDPALQRSEAESMLEENLFEGLTGDHPITTEPIAGMATHYRLSADGKQYTFYLRGHPAPQGIRLPDITSLPNEYSRGIKPPPDSMPARWSDGSPVTAHDFVYAWRRFADPKTGFISASDLAIIESADDILAGKLPKERLGVEAVDDFTFAVRLRYPAPYFLSMSAFWYPLPRRVLERFRVSGNEDAWAKPANLVCNGPFVVSSWRPYESVKLRENAFYYAKNLVRLEEVTFLPVASGATPVNLYRSGGVQALNPTALPYSVAPALQNRGELEKYRLWRLEHLTMNLRQPPFNNRLLRLAISMAIDRSAMARLVDGAPLRHVTISGPKYPAPESLFEDIAGKRLDILAYDPEGARWVLAAAGYPNGVGRDGSRLSFKLHTPTKEQDVACSQIIAYELQKNLNIDARVTPVEPSVLWHGVFADHFSDMEYTGDTLSYGDPYAFLGYLPSDNAGYVAGFDMKAYYASLDSANAIRDAAERFRRLAESEALLMRSMTIIPLCTTTGAYLLKPYVRGWTRNLAEDVYFRYAWIDTAWKPDTGWKP
jgi:ABC-type oligopeptide transport system substrate-binding subunit